MHSHTLDDWRHEHVFLGAAHDRNEPPECTLPDDFRGRGKHRTMYSMMTYEYARTGALGDVAKASSGFQGMRHGLFDQCADPRADALQRMVDVQVIRCRQNDSIGTMCGKHLRQGRIKRDIGRSGNRGSARRWIDDRR